MKTHVIIQTSTIQFFNDIAVQSARFLELAKSDDVRFVVIGFDDAMKEVAILLDAVYLNMKHASTAVLTAAHADIYMNAAAIDIDGSRCLHADTVTLLNGICFSEVSNELMVPDEVNTDTHTYLLHYHASLRILAYLYSVNEDIQINNVWEDPLQHKLISLSNYIEAYKVFKDFRYEDTVKHFYFHATKDNTYSQKISNDHDDVLTTKFKVSPSQQYPYLHALHYSDFDGSNKFYNFGFSMTNVWKDRDDRTKVIDALMHYSGDDKYLLDDRIVFRFFSRAKHQQEYSKKLLPYFTYLQLIRQSKFTLNIPSYDNTMFSLRRMAESLSVGCIPLILDSCDLTLFDECPVTKQFIQDELTVSIEDVSNYNTILAYAKDYSYLYNKLINLPFFRKYRTSDVYVSTLKDMKIL